MAEPLFDRLCLIGLGLIGSSLARVARERGDIARTLVACDHGVGVAARLRELDLADVVEVDATEAVKGCDAVILCTPVGSFASVMAQIAPHLAPGAILSDTGSTTGSVLRDCEHGPLMTVTADDCGRHEKIRRYVTKRAQRRAV